MVIDVRQGDVCWVDLENAGRRPVLVVTRDSAIPVLTSVIVAPVTRTIRRIPTEIALGPANGLRDACAAAFDNLRPVPKAQSVPTVSTRFPLRLRPVPAA